MANDRPAVRIVCVDRSGRLLLLRWHDPVDERDYWEPPGGGIDPGESPLDAARRELYEETGLPGHQVTGEFVPVHRDFRLLGVHYVKTEPFFLARFPQDEPPSRPTAFTPGEDGAYRGSRWFTRAEIAALPDLEPVAFITDIGPLLEFGTPPVG
ncbi:MAG: NUDIX domain-containing protein [Streptosporangiaceae bacterium]